MSIRMPGGRFFTDDELLLLLPTAKTVRAAHIRNGGGTSPLLSLADAIFNDANGITTVAVYAKDGTLVGTVDSSDVNLIGGGRSADRLVDGGQNAPSGALSVDPALTYLSAQEVADQTGLHVRRVTEMLKKGQITGHQPSGTRGMWMVEKESVERWAAERQQRRVS